MTELIVALDVETLERALELVDAAGAEVEWYKIGSQLFCEAGPDAVKALKERGKKVFLDLKFHDIPNTVANAVSAGVRMGADMLNVHASGGTEMMRAAVKASAETAGKLEVEPPLVIAVTVLTSMDAPALREVMSSECDIEPAEQVERLAKLAANAGMDGVVCSAREIEIIKSACGENFSLIVPGIRPAGSALGDQKRVMTPAEAAAGGANFIVVGRPVLRAENPAAAARAIRAELVDSE